MLANWVKQATATTGTGTVTLTASESGFVDFGDQFNDGAYVHYFIVDGDNREEGKGVYSSDTLTRVEIISTLVSGTLSKFPGTGISLSGSAIVTVNSTSDNISGRGIAYGVGASQRDAPDNVSSYADTVINGVALNLYLMPAIIQFRRRVTEIWVQITTLDGAATGTKGGYGGIWAQDSNGAPGLLLADSGAIDVTTTGVKTNTITEVVLEPGIYWFGFKVDSEIVAGKGVKSITGNIIGGPGGLSEFNTQRRQLLVAGSVPLGALSSNPTITTAASDSIMIGFNE